MKAIQYTDSFQTLPEAVQALNFCQESDGYLGGRLLMPGPVHGPAYRIQVFYEAEDTNPADLLPDGCRLVWVPASCRRSMGFRD